MNNAQKMQLIKDMVDGIFNSKAMMSAEQWQKVPMPAKWTSFIKMWNPRMFKNSVTQQYTLRGIDLDIHTGKALVQLRILEQNPDKTYPGGNTVKPLAQKARQGHRIAWAIDRNVDNGWLGSLQDGEWIPATNPAYTTAAPEALNRPVEENLPVFPEEDIPESVIQAVMEMEMPDDFEEGYED
jgi:hypothetical protein